MDEKFLNQFLLSEPDPAFARRVRTIFYKLDLTGNERILDLGCGRGFYLSMLSSWLPDLELYGVDSNDKYLSVARKNLDMTKVKLVNCSAYNLPFKDNFFDRVIFTEVLEHLKDDKKPLEEIYRVLKSRGKAIITVPNSNYPFLWDPLNWLLEGVFKVHTPPNIWWLAGIWADHARLYSKEELLKKLEVIGFKIDKFWLLTQHCFPLSNFFFYGIGMKLVEAGLFASLNRFSKQPKQSLINKTLLWPVREMDRLNRREVIEGPSVNIAVKVSKPRF